MASDGEIDGAGIIMSDAVQEFTCGTCNQGNRVTEASHYCPECDQCYCRTCLCDHSVLGKADLHRWRKPQSQNEDLTSDGVEMCLSHPGYEYSFYCLNDDVPCCKICLTVEHRACKKKLTMKDAADEGDLEKDVNTIKSDIDNIKRGIFFISYDSKFRERNAVHSHSEYIEHMRGIRKDINDIMDRFEANANTNLKHLQEQFKTDQHICEKLQKEIRGIESSIELPANYRTKYFIQVKRSREVIGGMLNTVSSIRKADLRENFLKPQLNVDNILKQIEDMGKLVMVVSQRKYDCIISSACQIDNGDLMLVDVDNKAVLQVDDTLNITKTLKFDQTPQKVCSAGANSIALLFDNATVQFIYVGDCEKPKEVIKLQEAVNHLTVLDNKIFTACKQRCQQSAYCCHNICVKSFSKTSDELFSKTINVGGPHVLSFESKPVVAHAKNLFLSNLRTVWTWDTEGNEFASVNLDHCITDLAVDDLGFVYAGGNGDMIYKIAETGKEIVERISGETLGISSPQILCWDNRSGRLVVRCDKGNTLYWI